MSGNIRALGLPKLQDCSRVPPGKGKYSTLDHQKVDVLKLLHTNPLPNFNARSGTVGAAAYALGDGLAVTRYFENTRAHYGHAVNSTAIGLSSINRSFMLISGHDALTVAQDAKALSSRIDDEFGARYAEMNEVRGRVEMAAGGLWSTALAANIMSGKCTAAKTVGAVATGGFIFAAVALFSIFTADFGIYTEKANDFRKAFPSDGKLADQMQFLYDQLLLTKDEKDKVLCDALYHKDGGILTSQEMSFILLPHEIEEIQKNVVDDKNYRSFGKVLDSNEEENLVLLIASETAKKKLKKRKNLVLSVGVTNVEKLEAVIRDDFEMQAVARGYIEAANGAALPEYFYEAERGAVSCVASGDTEGLALSRTRGVSLLDGDYKKRSAFYAELHAQKSPEKKFAFLLSVSNIEDLIGTELASTLADFRVSSRERENLNELLTLIEGAPSIGSISPRVVVMDVKKANINSVMIYAAVTVVCVVAIVALAFVFSMKLAFFDTWLWLVVGIAMLAIDVFFLIKVLGASDVTKKERAILIMLFACSVITSLGMFFMLAELIRWLSLSLSLLLTGYFSYAVHEKDSSNESCAKLQQST